MRNLLVTAIVSFGLWALGAPAQAQAPAGSPANGCGGFVAPPLTQMAYPAFVTKKGTVFYSDKTGDARSGPLLAFGDPLNVIDPDDSGTRLKVRWVGSATTRTGWVEKASMLCRPDAMRDPRTELFLRAFIRTATYGEPAGAGASTPPGPGASAPAPGTAADGSVTIAHNFNGECETARCLTASRFYWFFVYAEENDHYLISYYPTARGRVFNSSDRQFLGWVKKTNMIPWSTSLALRPSVSLAEPAGRDERFVCAYARPEHVGSRDEQLCSRVYGGRRWFTKKTRLPILEETDRHYRVAIPASLRNNREEGDSGTVQLKGYEGVDVVFAIDGTQSMVAAIGAIKGSQGKEGLVTRINNRLRNQYRELGPIRFGFQIYRDSAPMNIDPARDGVQESERLELDGNCRQSNQAAFTASFARVQAKEATFPKGYGDPDLYENTLGGIEAAAKQFETCPKHFKVLVVVGDHGYSAAAQSARGRPAKTPQAVADQMRGRAATGGAPSRNTPTVVFVQTPNDGAGGEYEAAFSAFRAQAKDLVKALWLPETRGSTLREREAEVGRIADAAIIEIPRGQGVTETAVPEKVLAGISAQFRPDLVARIAQCQEALGISVSQCIDSLPSDTDAPVILKPLLRQNLCKDLGPECERTAKDSVGEAFIQKVPPTDKSISFDVLLEKDVMDKWIALLGFFETTASVDFQRAQIISALQERLQTLFVFDIRSDRSIVEQLQRASRALPGQAVGALLKYRIRDLQSEATVPSCEIGLLANYARQKRAMLGRISSTGGTMQPTWTSQQTPGDCTPSPVGRELDFIRGFQEAAFVPASTSPGQQPNQPSTPQQGRPASLRGILFDQDRISYYWLPSEYLP